MRGWVGDTVRFANPADRRRDADIACNIPNFLTLSGDNCALERIEKSDLDQAREGSVTTPSRQA